MIAVSIFLISLAVINAVLIAFLMYDSHETEIAFEEIRRDAEELKNENAKLREITSEIYREKLRQLKLKEEYE